MKLNRAAAGPALVTHEGAPARRVNEEAMLRRSVMSCLLWEREFYEDGQDIASRICDLVGKVKAETVAGIAVEAREKMKLRHVPLLIVRAMAQASPAHRRLVAATLNAVIKRADEPSEFLAIYWKVKRQPLSAQVKKGLARAITKFDAYSLAKYNRDEAVKLRDVLFLTHAKPKDDAQAATWKALIDGTLPSPDTWEVALSSGADKKATWERLLSEGKLFALALLRNLRNMREAGVNPKLVKSALASMDASKVLPFRFIAAARHAPEMEPELEAAMFRCCETMPKLGGETVLLLDVSGSMDEALSGPQYRGKRTGEAQQVNRIDAACGLAMVAREMCEDVAVYAFSDSIKRIPSRRGFALGEAIRNSMPHNGTYLGAAVSRVVSEHPESRMIVVTDEQSADPVGAPKAKGYMINVASAKNGVGYGKWTHLDGFSESILTYIKETE